MVLVGQQPLPEDVGDFVERDPLLTSFARRVGQNEALLPSALPEGYADRDQAFWHGTIDNGETLVLSACADTLTFTVQYVGARSAARLSEVQLVYLQVSDHVGPDRLIEAAHRAYEIGGQPLFVFGELPRDPERSPPISPD